MVNQNNGKDLYSSEKHIYTYCCYLFQASMHAASCISTREELGKRVERDKKFGGRPDEQQDYCRLEIIIPGCNVGVY